MTGDELARASARLAAAGGGKTAVVIAGTAAAKEAAAKLGVDVTVLPV
jgi:hypothetical protein